MVSNRDFKIAVNKFFFYAMNFKSEEFDGVYAPNMFRAFNDDKPLQKHLISKYNYYTKEYGNYGAMMAFYGELDGESRSKILEFINDNYSLREDFGIEI